MRHFSGLTAMVVQRTTGLDLPFIVVPSPIGEAATVAAMRG